MTSDTAASRRSFFVMRMFFERSGARAIQREWPVAIQAELVSRLSQLRVVVRAMYVVATEAGDPTAVHHALHKIISLHAILVSRAVRVMGEGRLGQRVLFELPKILQA
jgi:hypothetical protein